MTFTMDDIESAWEIYKSRQVLRIQKAGVWEWHELNGKGIPRLDATKAEIKKMSDVVGFPEFLRKHYGS